MKQLIAIVVTVLFLMGGRVTAESGKKFIELGWDIPTTAFLRDHWREMEANSPFDGVIYDLSATASDGTVCSSQTLWSARQWNPADFESCISDLNACEFTKFRDNFIRVNFHPADIRWDDDAAWGTIFEKIKICVHVLKMTGGTGLSLDFESYGSALFRWNPDETESFTEAKRLARKRGAELIAATGEYPNQTILCLWMNSINLAAGRLNDPDTILLSSGYGLLPAFIDGMLDVLPPEMTLVDGCENGYYIEGGDYAQVALDMILFHGPAIRLVSPENRRKYRAQVQAGFGFYLDMYSNPEGNIYYRGPLEGGTRMDRLERNLRAAWDATDEFVWIYGEQHRWWNLSEKSGPSQHWDDALPGLSSLIEKIKDPTAAALKRLEKLQAENLAVNLLVNGDFSLPPTDSVTGGKEGTIPRGWGFWQHENHQTGHCSVRDGAAFLENVTNGCLLQTVNVQPGEDYLVTVTVRCGRRATPTLRLRWQTADGAWTQVEKDVLVGPESDSETVKLATMVRVPEGVGKIAVLLGAADQKKEADNCCFDDVRLIRIP